MAFIDTARVHVRAGKGGDGAVSFRHEKWVDRGGPDGGDGGDGGDVIFFVDRNLNTLAHFRYKQELYAENGGRGAKRKRHGKAGEDLRIGLPRGTVIRNGDIIVADLIDEDTEVVIAEGGKGGFGNAHFTSSKRQAPKFAEKGEPGDEFELSLELKMLADIGLVGLPNAGKSTLLSRISNARPSIADYPFTTLKPNLGVATIDEENLLVADIPGLIEGASEGKGLGDDFLRHVERTAVLIHLVDAYSEDIAADYRTIQTELKNYQVDLTKRDQIVAVSKTEGMDQEMIDDIVTKLKSETSDPVIAISSMSGDNLDELLRLARKRVEAFRKIETKKEETEEIKTITLDEQDTWKVSKEKKKYVVEGYKINRFATRTDFENEFAVRRLRDIMYKMGIDRELDKLGISTGDKVWFKDADVYMEY